MPGPAWSQHMLLERRSPAGGEVSWLDLDERRLVGAASIDGEGAAQAEPAARRHVEGVRHDSFDGGELLLIRMQLGYRSEQPDRIGVLGVGEQRRDVGSL